MKINLFHHVADIPLSEVIFEEQFKRIENSGILSGEIVYHICVNGDVSKFESYTKSSPNKDKLKILQVADNPKKWEYPTLCYLKSIVDNEEEKSHICYIHLKGARQPNNSKMEDWRKMMEYFIIDKYQECVRHLNERYNIVGVNWISGRMNNHFSGNFWWANSDYIKTLELLPNPDTISIGQRSPITGMMYDHSNWRYDHEGWISTGKYREKELHNSMINHYESSYPEHLYMNKK